MPSDLRQYFHLQLSSFQATDLSRRIEKKADPLPLSLSLQPQAGLTPAPPALTITLTPASLVHSSRRLALASGLIPRPSCN